MGRISTSDAKEQLSERIDRAAVDKERIILAADGHDLVALVPIEDLEFLEELEDRFDLKEARAVLVEVEREGTVPWEQVKARLGL